jgi:AGZA family xanthine/uracil permease-like MFS transporter
MTFAFNISYGIAAGFIFHCIIKIVQGKIKKVHPILAGATLLFLINFVIIAFRG